MPKMKLLDINVNRNNEMSKKRVSIGSDCNSSERNKKSYPYLYNKKGELRKKFA